MADCPHRDCGQTHQVRSFTETGYIFECPAGHEWVREDENAEPEGALETFHHQDGQFGDHVRVSPVDRPGSAFVHALDEDGNFLVTLQDHLRITVDGELHDEPTITVESDEYPAALTVSDREGSFTEVTLGEDVDE